METKTNKQQIERIIEAIDGLVPEYLNDPIDKNISDGNVALCIVDEKGNVFGRIYGDDKLWMRRSYLTAWTKASQVWITGIATGEYEKKVFNGEIEDSIYGISKPDMIGWEGGQPIVLRDGTKLSVGFSGFRGCTDIEIVARAVKMVEG